MKKLCVLGSTGSIGRQTLEAASLLQMKVDVLCARSRIDLLEKQIRAYHPSFAVCTDTDAAEKLKTLVADTDTKVLGGTDEMLRLVAAEDFDTVVNGIAGMAGTLPTVRAVEAGKNVVTANKESIVTAWDVLLPLIRKHGVSFLSCDSEHSAVQQSIGIDRRAVDTITLTASGGPFFGKTEEELNRVTVQDALRHPNWSMGPKITIDCATMMNKGLEIIEAAHLFDIKQKDIKVVIHRESIIHSLVTFKDGSTLCQMSRPDMRLPIQYALTYPERVGSLVEPLDLAAVGKMTLYEPTPWAQRAMNLARTACDAGGTAPTVFNTANEIAVERFVRGEIGFTGITDFVETVMNRVPIIASPTLEDILETDRRIRAMED